MPRFLLLPLLLGVGCAGVSISDVTAVVSEDKPTVVTVTWQTSEPVQSYVAFGSDGDLSMSTPLEAEPATEHHAYLLGLTADTAVSLQVVALDGDEEVTSDVEEVTTGWLSSGLPLIEVTGSGMDHYMVLPILGEKVGVVIIDPQGDYVWWHYEERDLDVYRAMLSRDGESVLYNAAHVSGEPSSDSQIVRVALDGSWTETIDVPLLAHDFVEHADGTIGAMVAEYGEDAEGNEVMGNAIVEIAPDGTQTTVWSAFDCFDPDEQPGDSPELGWSFGNALDWDGAHYYQSLRNFSTVVQVDPADGSCGWAFGDTGATIETDSAADRFLHSHQFEILPESFLVFDNDGAVEQESRVLEYSFDPDSGATPELIWEYRNPADPLYSFVLGDVHRFDDGDTLVTWSVNGKVQRVENDVPIWEIQTEFGRALGFNTVRESLYAIDDL
jgi:hypothetical protein